MARFLTGRWEHLVMLNYAIDPILLRDRVPRGTTLDARNGKCFVSVVGFMFRDTRVLGVPVPGHRTFEEVNLRFYVRREVNGEQRRGVVFIKEIVPRAAIAWMANALYNERYVTLPMSHAITHEGNNLRVTYRFQDHDRRYAIDTHNRGDAFTPADDSEETFITEHYWGYVTQRDGSTVEYQVEHPRWQVWRTEHATFEGDIASLYGAEFAPFLSAPPTSTFIANGSDIVVHQGVRIE